MNTTKSETAPTDKNSHNPILLTCSELLNKEIARCIISILLAVRAPLVPDSNGQTKESAGWLHFLREPSFS
jgi:hypothetical protein